MKLKEDKRVAILLKKREIILKKIYYYNNLEINVFRLRSYQPHIKRNTKKLHEINEEIYKLTGIDRKSLAL